MAPSHQKKSLHQQPLEDIDVLKDAWLRNKRLRSDPGMVVGETRTRHIGIDDQVMGPANVLKQYKFLGHERSERGLEEDDTV